MASVKINRDKDGKIISYRVRAQLGYDESGKEKTSTKTIKPPEGLTPARALKAVQAEADAWEAKIKAGATQTKKKSFADFIENDFLTVAIDGKREMKPSSRLFYKNMCKRLVDAFGHREIKGISSLDLQKYINGLGEETKSNGELLSNTTILHQVQTIRKVFAFAARHRLIDYNPALELDVPKRERREVIYYTTDEARELLGKLDSAPLRWRVMITTYLKMGLRRGEGCGLIWEDIDFKAKTINVCRSAFYTPERGIEVTTPKTYTSIRLLPAPDSLLLLLRQWQVEQARIANGALMPTAFVFGTPTDPYKPLFPQTPTQWFDEFLKANGLRDVRLHDLRHTTASLMQEAGATITECQQFLGHADPATTLKFYTGTSPEALRGAANKLDTMLS